MKLSAIKSELKKQTTIAFELPNGTLVAPHFHVTEVGRVSKHFIDCGGSLRVEETINFQLWEADDYNHRLHPEKLVHIIELAEKTWQLPDLEIEVEYQMADSIGKFGLAFNGRHFLLTSKRTNCLAKESCGFLEKQEQPKAIESEFAKNSCTPQSDCC